MNAHAFALAFAPSELGSPPAPPAPPAPRDALPETEHAPPSPSTTRTVAEPRELRRDDAREPGTRKEQLRLVLHRGCALVAWVDRTAFGFGALWFARSLDGGVTFEPEIALSLGAGSPRDVQVAATDARVSVAWIEDAGGESRVWIATSDDVGERFSEPTPLGEASAPRTERY